MFQSQRSRNPLFLSALALTAAATALFASLSLAAPTDKKKPPSNDTKPVVKPVQAVTETDRIVHALNRLAYGPRPGDVEKVKAMGLSRYIEQQLHPEQVNDTAVETKLAAFTTLRMSGDQLAAQYHDLMQYSKQMQALNKRAKKQVSPGDTQAGKGAPIADAAGPGSALDPATPNAARKAAKKPMAMDPAMRGEVREARQMLAQAAGPVARAHAEFMAAKTVRAVESERQLQEVLVDFWGNHFNIDIRKQPCGVLKILDDREVIRPHVLGKFRDLLGASAKSPAMLVYLDNYQSMSETASAAPAGRRPANRAKRLQQQPGQTTQAAGSPAQRLQQMVASGQIPARRAQRIMQRIQEGQIPPGRVNRLLGQSGQAARSAQAPAGQTPAAPPNANKKRPTGLNENYAREIMELHTLGVDGGYMQQDVREVARCLTGWTVTAAGRRPGAGKYAEAGAYRFNPAMHDNGEKKVLGHVIPAGGGEKDGEMVLDILASHPATMRHISEQLCQRLVADQPPASLIDKCVATWKRTDGDLREIVRTIVTSQEFYAPTALRSKIKSPFEYAVSSVRALGGTIETASVEREVGVPCKAVSLIKPPKGGGYLDLNTTSLVGQVGTMGQPLFQYQAPTGYPEDSQKWVSSGALISRLNFALALTAGKLGDVKLQNLDAAAANPEQAIDRTAAQILHTPVSTATRATLLKQVRLAADDPAARSSALTGSRVAALLLGSPEFQRH